VGKVPAGRVVPDNELLYGQLVPARQLLDQKSGEAVGRIALIGVMLDGDPAVELGLVRALGLLTGGRILRPEEPRWKKMYG
jgi:hypothetical protein